MSRTNGYNIMHNLWKRLRYYDSRARILMFDLGSSVDIGRPCQPFEISPKTRETRLGSGIRFSDEIIGMREIGANAGRIEGWRKSASYESIGRRYEGPFVQFNNICR